MTKRQFEDFVIESNIPINDEDRHTTKGKWLRLAKEMDLGDSFIANTHQEICCFRSICKKLGFKVRSRIIRDDNGNSTQTFRVWKIAK
jgi:hypothetical protein|tara:strand:- start:797 stop:1060 length:264 start_codon:yes stop_codon:yes gene_type:complete